MPESYSNNNRRQPLEETYKVSMEEETLMSLGDYLEILNRRKWSLIIPTISIFLIAAVLALILPAIYKSTATILIEEQQIPSEYVKATVTSYAEQRIQQINQRIMSTSRLLEIINQFDLYKKLRANHTTYDIVTRMRANIQLDPISAEVMDRRLGRTIEATIAFSLSFQGQDSPQKVQQVAEKLTDLFLEENQEERTKQTKEASRFLEDELNKVKSSLDSQESRIARFKEQHINTLPELLQVNIQSLNNIERNIEMVQEQLRSLKEQEGYLQSQLINMSPDLEEQQEDKKRLDELKVLLINLKSRFTDEYPDVINTRSEIIKLEKQLAKQKSNHPASKDGAENPAYITLAAQLSSIQADIKSTNQQIVTMIQKAEKYRKQIEETPRVEETYKTLSIKRNNTRAKYDDLMQKLLEAQVSQGLESEQKGERFTIIDPPLFPEKPFKPNRLAIIMIGIVLGIGAGVGFTTLREFYDNSVHSARSLTLATTFPVLATIPDIMTPPELAQKPQ
jgi:polysaccharide chain length determinant protein (PEP-CTERM system associated)